jgi:hypothetical protein
MRRFHVWCHRRPLISQSGDVWFGEIFIVREGVAVFEPQIICRLHADSQQMSKQHVSEECCGY